MDDRSSKLDGSDLERNESSSFFKNNTVNDFSWRNLTVTVKDRHTKQPRNLIDGISGSVQQGWWLLPGTLCIHPGRTPD